MTKQAKSKPVKSETKRPADRGVVTGRFTSSTPNHTEVDKKSNGPTLPASLLNVVPSATKIMTVINTIPILQKQLEFELEDAKKAGAVTLARAYVVLHRLTERIGEELQVSDSGQVFGPLVKQYKTIEIPAAMEQAGITHVPLDEGFRVGVSSQYRASIKPDMKDKAYQWLRENGLADLISATVNASTLSAAVKAEIEEHNKEFPDDLFNVALVPSTSVTKTNK